MSSSQFTNDDNPGERGRARMRELAAEMKAAIEINVASLLACLNREPTELERMQAEMLASLFLRARRLREAGRNDVALIRQAAQLIRDVPFLQNPPPEPTTEQHA